MEGKFIGYTIVTDFNGKVKNFTSGKKYLFIVDLDIPYRIFKIMNDRKEWVEYTPPFSFNVTLVTSPCKIIKKCMFGKKDTIIDFILSHDKKTFLRSGHIYNTKEYLKIL